MMGYNGEYLRDIFCYDLKKMKWCKPDVVGEKPLG